MKILIVGSGICGASIARLLYDRGHRVKVVEKENRVGGLCVTDVNEHGFKYEPYGARTFHTSNQRIIQFVTKYADFNGYTHRKGMIVNGKLFPFPLTKQAIHDFDESEQILSELNNRPETVDMTNFETACISLFGPTLYGYFIKNYTRNMWGVHPSKLTADWAPKRLELREDNNGGLFEDQWQGLPLEGYSKFIENILAGIPVKLRTTGFNAHEFDVVAYSGPIDRILSYKYGELRYRSLMFSYKNDEPWDKEEYGTINLPQHPESIRKCNFKVLHKQVSKHNYIQYQEPIEANGTNVPMYPIHTPSDNERFFIYLKELCSQGNVCPIGRLGLYKYLDMDKAVEVAFDMVDIIENYLLLNGEERIRRISEVCDSR